MMRVFQNKMPDNNRSYLFMDLEAERVAEPRAREPIGVGGLGFENQGSKYDRVQRRMLALNATDHSASLKHNDWYAQWAPYTRQTRAVSSHGANEQYDSERRRADTETAACADTLIGVCLELGVPEADKGRLVEWVMEHASHSPTKIRELFDYWMSLQAGTSYPVLSRREDRADRRELFTDNGAEPFLDGECAH